MTSIATAPNEIPIAAEARIATLLDSDAIDLTGISDAIRERPGLQELVLALSESLALAPGKPAGTVEEAAIVLGKNRLRILVRAWSLARNRGAAACEWSQPGRELPPEVLYLSSFFRWLGLDAPPIRSATKAVSVAKDSDAGEHVAALADLLMRDIVSLIPYVDPVLPKAQHKAGRGIHPQLSEASTK
jgi:hypothetical protein